MRKKKKSIFAVLLTALLIAPPALWLLGTAAPLLTPGAVLLSAAFAMPQGVPAMLEKRFAIPDKDPDEWVELPPEENSGSSASEGESSHPEQSSGRDNSSQPDESSSETSVPDIPEKNRGLIVARQYEAEEGGIYLKFGEGLIRNSTEESAEEILAELQTPLSMELEDSAVPQVLIVHTHATESFEPYGADYYDTTYTFRSTDNDKNVVSLGQIIADVLERNGITALHSEIQHDYPSYNGSYDRSAETIQRYLDEYPSIKVVLDIHRDAIEQESGVLIKPIARIDGRDAAQIMIVSGCDDGTMDMPDYYENLRFAAALQNRLELDYPGLMRPLFYCYRKYNMDLSTGALLIEIGAHGNSFDEVNYSAELFAQSLSAVLRGQIVQGK